MLSKTQGRITYLCGNFPALVEYALAGMDNQLFVSKYQLELPGKDKMQRFIEAQLKEDGASGQTR